MLREINKIAQTPHPCVRIQLKRKSILCLCGIQVVHLVWVSNNTVDIVLQEPEGMSWQNLSLNSEGFPHSRKLLQKLP